ncbi:MAG: hypothetical protein KBS76_08170 [Ruminococcus sp.]|nr:hypothetical protein [Candidatus Apopatosoma intestinale]
MECTVRRQKRIGRRILFFFVILLCVLLMLVAYIDNKLDPLVMLLAEAQAKNRISGIINDATERALSEESISYEDLVQIRYGEDGTITSLSADSLTMTKLRTKITEAILQDFRDLAGFTVVVSFSNILDDEVIFGRFPDLQMPASIDPASAVESRLKSEFLSAGINQTLHRITAEITAHVCVLTLISNLTFDMIAEVSLAETLIVGDVPSAYFS